MTTGRRWAGASAASVAVVMTTGCLDPNPYFDESTLPTGGASLGASSTTADPPDPTGQGTTAAPVTDSSDSGSMTATTTTTTTSDTQSTTGAPASCGDGVVDMLEECDQGPNNADDAECTSTCKLAVCGDGLVHAGVEYCDDVNDDPADGCVGCFVPHVCKEVQQFGPPGLPSDYYELDPEANGELVLAYCDMELDGGGWTRVERSPLADPIGHALFVDFEWNYDAPDQPRYRMSRAALTQVVQHSMELWIDCGGDDHLWADMPALFAGEDQGPDCYNVDVVHYKEARLGQMLITDVDLCTGFTGLHDGECPGAWRIDESEQMSCGLSMTPWDPQNNMPYTLPTSDIFAVDPQVPDVEKHECHQDGAVRAILMR